MTPDLQREFQLLAAKAKERLKEIPQSGSHRRVFSFWEMPSFTPHTCCTVYAPLRHANNVQPLASFTVWRNDLDLEKFRTPIERLKYSRDLQPSIEEDSVFLTNNEIDVITQTLRAISIPIFIEPSRVVGCDGTSFEFQADFNFCDASLHWWEDQPQIWRPLTEAVRNIVRGIELRRDKKERKGAG